MGEGGLIGKWVYVCVRTPAAVLACFRSDIPLDRPPWYTAAHPAAAAQLVDTRVSETYMYTRPVIRCVRNPGEIGTRTGVTAALLADDTMASASGHVSSASCIPLEAAYSEPLQVTEAPLMEGMDEGAGEGFADSPQLELRLSGEQGERSNSTQGILWSPSHHLNGQAPIEPLSIPVHVNFF